MHQFTCLPFGLLSALWAFTKTVKLAVALLQQLGVRSIVYIVDILILEESRAAAMDHRNALTYLVQCLGFVINHEKPILHPMMMIEFLDIILDSAQSELLLLPRKIKDTNGSTTNNKTRSDFRSCISEVIGKDEGHTISNTPSSPLLLPFTNGPDTNVAREQLKVQCLGTDLTHRHTRAMVVGLPHVQMEQEDTTHERRRQTWS